MAETTNDDDGSIAVVKPHYLTEEAYRLGYDRFEDADEIEADDVPAVDHFHSSATYANTVLPRLRCMAGMDDSGPGTYQVDRKVAAIKPGCEEDEPAEAELVEARHLAAHLIETWNVGAEDALRGEDPEPDRVGGFA